MKSKSHSRSMRNLAAAMFVGVLATTSFGPLFAQSTITLPIKQDGDVGGLTVQLTSVQKTGDQVMVKFVYTNGGDKEIDMYRQAGGQVDEKIYYVDAKNKKKYLVIRDTEDHPLSSNMHDMRLSAGETKNCWAKFPAPPPDATAISIYIPGAPPFENVPLTP